MLPALTLPSRHRPAQPQPKVRAQGAASQDLPSLYKAPRSGTTTNVSYRLLTAQGRTVRAYSNDACFGGVTYSEIAPEVAAIEVTHRLSLIPHSAPVIGRWIEEIDSLGFPCRLAKPLTAQSTHMEVRVDLNQYSKKVHLAFTLQLIRALTETGICRVPNRYFALLAAEPATPRFVLLQKAHKMVEQIDCREDGGYGPNTNHMITSVSSNGEANVKASTFWNRVARHEVGIREAGRWGMYSGIWKARAD